MTIAKLLFIVPSSSIAVSKSAKPEAVRSDKSLDRWKPSWLPSTNPAPVNGCEKSVENMEPEIVKLSVLYTFKIGLSTKFRQLPVLQMLLMEYFQSW